MSICNGKGAPRDRFINGAFCGAVGCVFPASGCGRENIRHGVRVRSCGEWRRRFSGLDRLKSCRGSRTGFALLPAKKRSGSAAKSAPRFRVFPLFARRSNGRQIVARDPGIVAGDLGAELSAGVPEDLRPELLASSRAAGGRIVKDRASDLLAVPDLHARKRLPLFLRVPDRVAFVRVS